MIASPPETPAAGETLERIAKRIARKHVCGCHECKTDRAALETDILSALRSARDRAVRIIDEHQAMDVCRDNCWTTIKNAIREGR